MENQFKTTHNLDFNSGEYKTRENHTQKIQTFSIGTCIGTWGVSEEGYEIYSVNNTKIGNGHFTDVLEWFEFSAKRDKGCVIFANVTNDKLLKHLTEKKGYEMLNEKDIIKDFDPLAH